MKKNSILIKIYLPLALISAVFIWLAILAHNLAYFGFDLEFGRLLQRSISETAFPWQGLAYFVSFFGVTSVAALMIVITALIFTWHKMKREAVFILLTPLASLINYFVKIIIDRPRPSSELITVIDKQFDASFPSGHTVFYTVFFGFIVAVMWRYRKISSWLRMLVIAFSIFMIISIAFSRIYLGAHWASDILAGYLLGGICLLILLHYYGGIDCGKK